MTRYVCDHKLCDWTCYKTKLLNMFPAEGRGMEADGVGEESAKS